MWVVAVVLLIPIVPAVVLGESWLQGLWQSSDQGISLSLLVLAATCLLAADILLPVPSAPLLVLLAGKLGVVGATAVGVVGLTLGGLLGYCLARYGGRALASRFADAVELRRWEQAFNKQGGWLILVTRPIPIVAESIVLAAGLGRMQVKAFACYLFVGNLIVVVAYTLLGAAAARYELGLVAASAIALASVLGIRALHRRQ